MYLMWEGMRRRIGFWSRHCERERERERGTGPGVNGAGGEAFYLFAILYGGRHARARQYF